MSAELSGLVGRLEAVTSRLEAVAIGGRVSDAAASLEADEVPASVLAYDDIIKGSLAMFKAASNSIGDVIKEQGDAVTSLFDAQRSFLLQAAKFKQPSQDVLTKMLAPTSHLLGTVSELREKNRGHQLYNHLSALSESCPAMGWVTVSPTPGPYVKELSDAGQFYTNRVLKEFKEKDPKHCDWVKAWLTVLKELQAYIKQYHTTGVTWNAKGLDASSRGPAPPPPPGGAPAPPPPPPVELPDSTAPSGASSGGSKAEFLSELNKGTDITKGLKKVADDMKTHKNPNIRLGAAPYKTPSPSVTSVAPKAKVANAAPKKPPVFELQGKKWVVEYQDGNKDIVISDTNIKQTVYAYRCENSTIQVKGKVNSITLDSCKKTAVVFEDVVAAGEFINCQSVQAQVTGNCPTVSIDKTDGCMVYLSKDSLDASFITAKSSEMNVLIPKDDGEFVEYPLPEQFRTTWDGKALKTTCADSI